MSELQAQWKPKVNPWIIAVIVSLAAFMEVLDTSIANVALPHIAGGLGVSNDESTWVLTSYLVSNAIVLPLSGYMVAAFGRKRFFMACIALFTVSSFLCGAATSLGLLLLFRVMQGAFGGGLQPMAQSILPIRFPYTSAAWRFPFTASRPSARRRLVQRWEAGSPITTPGVGCFTSTFRSVSWRFFWYNDSSKIRPTWRACERTAVSSIFWASRC